MAGAGVRARSPVAVAPTQREEHASTHPVPATCARDRAARRAPSPEHPPGASRLRSGVASHADESASIERLARSRTSAGVIRLEPESGMDTVPPFQSKAPRSGRASCRTQGGAKVTVRKDALLAQSMGPTLGPLGASVEALRRTLQAQCETERRGRTALRRRWVAKGSPNPRRVRPLDVIPPLRSLQTFARRPVTAETTPGPDEHGI